MGELSCTAGLTTLALPTIFVQHYRSPAFFVLVLSPGGTRTRNRRLPGRFEYEYEYRFTEYEYELRVDMWVMSRACRLMG